MSVGSAGRRVRQTRYAYSFIGATGSAGDGIGVTPDYLIYDNVMVNGESRQSKAGIRCHFSRIPFVE